MRFDLDRSTNTLKFKKMIAFVDCKAEILLNELAPKIHFSSAVIRPRMSGPLRKQ